MIFGSGAVLLGFALIALGLAGAPGLPSVAAVAHADRRSRLAGPAFFPFFMLIVWRVVVGVWLLLAGRGIEPSPMAEQPNG